VFTGIYSISNLLKHHAFIKYKIEAGLFSVETDGVKMETEKIFNIRREDKAGLFLKVIRE
jgi:hypothetical protein